MKTRLLFILLSTTVLILATTVSLSCKHPENKPDNKTEDITTHTFYYYPKANVYYDTVAKNYTYPSVDGYTWQTSKELPDHLMANLDTHVLLSNAASPVWSENEQHRMIYAVSLYASSDDVKEEKKNDERVYTAKAKKKQPAEKKNETGVEKFFKKLFIGKEDKERKR